MNRWTIEDMPDMSGRLAIVTGANNGLGYYTTLGLVKRGCTVIMACRNEEKGLEAIAKIRKDVSSAAVDLRIVDLSELSSVRRFADKVLEDYSRLDILINNAGVMAIPYSKTVDGFEKQMAVNHLGHFALTALLFETLKATDNSRIVSVSSMAHRIGAIDFEDFHYEQKYNKLRAYGNSKLANLYFIRELSERIRMNGTSLVAAAAHPGYANSGLLVNGAESPDLKSKVLHWANKHVAQSTEMGALPSLFAATSDKVQNGGFYGPDGRLGIKGYPKECSISRKKIDAIAQRKLWEYSQELTAVTFDV